MGWSCPRAWIEIETDEVNFTERVNDLGRFELWKVFLLGHGKYGSLPHLKPIKELRGLPQNVDKEIERFNEKEGEFKGRCTYYSLEELKSFDMEQKLPYPNPMQLNPLRSFVGITAIIEPKPGKKEKFPIEYFEEEVLRRAIENNGETSVEIYKKDGNLYTPGQRVKCIQNDRIEEGECNKIEAKLYLRRNTYAESFPKFQDFLDDLERKKKELADETVKNNDVKLIILPA